MSYCPHHPFSAICNPVPSAPSPVLRPTRIVFGMKTQSPALTLGSTQHDTRFLVTDADYRACGYDVYRLRNREDAGRVHTAINARNPGRAEWRAKFFEDEVQDLGFGDLIDIDEMFEVDDSEGIDVEDVDDDILNGSLEIPSSGDSPSSDPPSSDLLSNGSPYTNDFSFAQSQSEGEGPEREWSRIHNTSFDRSEGEGRIKRYQGMGIWERYIDSTSPIAGDVAQHMTARGVERLRASFESGDH